MGAVQPSSSSADQRWWQQRLPSIGMLILVLVAMTAATVMVGTRVARVLPDVGKDQLGADAWTDPLGIHLAGGFHVARVPDCAAGAFTRIVLWDPYSKPYWEVTGPPTPLTSFLVGVAPEGFTEVVSYRDPPKGAMLRLVAFRKDGGPVGIRYLATDLRPQRIVSMQPLQRFTIEGFQSAKVCGKQTGSSADTGVTTTTVP